MGPAESMGDWMHRHRSRVFLGIAIVFAVNIGYWAASNVLGNHFVGRWWVEDTGTAADFGLVLGTVGLAFAAYAQARTAARQSRVAERQADLAAAQAQASNALTTAANRQADLIREVARIQGRPSFAVQIRGVSVLLGSDPQSRVLSPGDLLAMGAEDQAFYVHN
jgi:hypothetical protein